MNQMNQITIEEMQHIIGRLTLNYELQLSRLTAELARLGKELEDKTEVIK